MQEIVIVLGEIRNNAHSKVSVSAINTLILEQMLMPGRAGRSQFEKWLEREVISNIV
jgi:hypothetical protein